MTNAQDEGFKVELHDQLIANNHEYMKLYQQDYKTFLQNNFDNNEDQRWNSEKLPKEKKVVKNTIMIKLKKKNYDRNKYHGNEIYRILGISYDQIFNTNSLIKIIYEDRHKNYLMSEEAAEKLKKNDYEIIHSAKERASRSLYCRQLDLSLTSMNAEELQKELESKNNWLQVEEVVKIRNLTHVIKIICRNENMAKRAEENGLYCGHVRISPSKISIEEYVDLLVCFHCYQYESHPTYACPKKDLPKAKKIIKEFR